jgi:hypothetical protein
MGKFACSAGEINRLIDRAKKDSLGERTQYRDRFVGLRSRQMQELEEIFFYLLRTVNTSGELGTIANWEQHNMTFFVLIPGMEIEKILHEKLPENCWPSRKVLERQRVIVPTLRNALRKGEDLHIRAILPSGEIRSARLCWRQLGRGKFMSRDLTHVARGVWEATIAGREVADDLEYFLEVRTPQDTLRYPVEAPERNQTVVVY